MKLPSSAGKSLRWIAACAVLVGGFEGLSTTAYHDKLANGLPTICYGETENVHMGDHYTVEQCQDLLSRKLERYWHEIEPSIHVTTSDNEKIAYTSFSYNLGSGAFRHSSFLKKLNEGDHKSACNGMLVYNRTRSVGYVPGLDSRRHKEAKVCLTIAQEGPALRVVPLNPSPYVAPPQEAPVPTRAPKTPQSAPKKPLVCHGWWLWKVCK
jgi:lysozyme